MARAFSIAASSDFDLRLELRHQRALGVDGLGGDDVGGKAGVALEVALGVGELRLVQRLLGDRLVELRLEGHRVDLRQHVALLDLLAFLEIDRHDLAVDLRAYGDQVAGLGGADAFQPYGHVGELGLRRHHRHGPVGTRPTLPRWDWPDPCV